MQDLSQAVVTYYSAVVITENHSFGYWPGTIFMQTLTNVMYTFS